MESRIRALVGATMCGTDLRLGDSMVIEFSLGLVIIYRVRLGVRHQVQVRCRVQGAGELMCEAREVRWENHLTSRRK